MKLQLAIVIGAILIGSLATVNMAFVQNEDISANSLKSTAGMLGHITLTAVDEDGNIVAYRQTDNVVINEGDDCLLEDTFGAVTACGDGSALFDDIHIGTSSQAFTESSTALGTWQSTTAGTVGTATTASANSGASVTVTAAFFDVNANIAEAALQNGPASASDILALQQFTPISLGATDDLTIEWTVTIDGS